MHNCWHTENQAAHTLRYVPGRLYEKEKKTGKGYLREERVQNVPVSFKKLNSFLKVKRRDLKIFVQETTEKEAGKPVGGASVDDDATDEADDEADDDEAAEGSECEPGNSDDEELFDDAPLGGVDDSEEDFWRNIPLDNVVV